MGAPPLPDSRRSNLWHRLSGRGGSGLFIGLSFTGLLFAALAVLGSSTPSLLPRSWYMQGIIMAVLAVLAYAIGTVVGAAGKAVAGLMDLRVSISKDAAALLTALWVIAIAGIVLGTPVFAFESQQLTHEFVGLPRPERWYIPASLAVGLLLFFVLVGLWRMLAGVTGWFTARLTSRALREGIARVSASVLTVLITLVTIDQMIMRGGLAIADYQAAKVNETEPSGRSAPTSALRSGGLGSDETWESLGQDGAIFVAGGPTRADIVEAVGSSVASAKEPVRVFVGVVNGYTLEEATRRVLAEMDRTGAFERSAVHVASSTSTGFVNEWSTSAFEYLTGGDCATVAMAYSSLPSAIALISDPGRPPEASRMLLDAVRARIAAMPQEDRPRLYAGGESLGAYAGNGAFDSPEVMLDQIDGAVWTGTPSFTPLHAELTSRRKLGSAQVNPIVDDGAHVRFASSPAELTHDRHGAPLGPWRSPRVVYLQHDSDPVVWWRLALAIRTPDWLRETRISGPMSQMSWKPLVTFWQVSADMSMGNEVPGGQGHRYWENETVPAWAAVLGEHSAPPTTHEQIKKRISAATH